MIKVTTEVKEQYKKQFWFIKNLSERVGEDFLVCSKEIACTLLWELCEKMQEEFADTNKSSTGRYINISAFINSLPYAEDEDIIESARKFYGIKYKEQDLC